MLLVVCMYDGADVFALDRRLNSLRVPAVNYPK